MLATTARAEMRTAPRMHTLCKTCAARRRGSTATSKNAALKDEPARLLGALLGDSNRKTRSLAANSLRLLGPRAQTATPQLIEYLRSGDNPYQAASALAGAPTRDLLSARDALEAVLDLLMRIEQHRSSVATDKAASPAAPSPRPVPTEAQRS